MGAAVIARGKLWLVLSCLDRTRFVAFRWAKNLKELRGIKHDAR